MSKNIILWIIIGLLLIALFNLFQNTSSNRSTSEISFFHQKDDLVPSLKATIQNPGNLVEGVAAKGWIRGGLPTRDLVRDQDYFQRCKQGC